MHWYYWLIIFILILFSAFFSAADLVYSSVDKLRLQKDAKEGKKTAKIALKLANRYELSISSILLANNIVNILASSIVAIIGVSFNQDYGATVAAIILTVVIIIFGEFLPKAFAKRFTYPLALYLSYPVYILCAITLLITYPISKLFQLFGKLFSSKAKEEDIIDDEVLDQMIDEIEENGEMEKEEADLVRGAIDLTDIEAFEIMTPRVDVRAIEYEEDISYLLTKKNPFKYSRIPVYKGTIDNIVGVVPVKSLYNCLINKETVNLDKLMVKPLFVPRNYQVLDLLSDFKKNRIHIAVVIDEYGGTDGIVTMEDILEEIVGDIFDEEDTVKEIIITKRKGNYIIDGMMNLDDFFEFIDYKDDFDTDYVTLGGFCQEFIEGFAKEGDTFKFGNYKFTVLEADEYTVKKVQVTALRKKSNDSR